MNAMRHHLAATLRALATSLRGGAHREAGEAVNAQVAAGASYATPALLAELAKAGGLYSAAFWLPAPARLDEYIALRDRAMALLQHPVQRFAQRPLIQRLRERMAAIQQDLVWEQRFANLVTTEGGNCILTHFLKGSTYTASQTLGLIEDTGYTAVAIGNTAANITAVGGGSPANGWNEAPVGTCASRGSPSFGAASSKSLATSSAVSMSMLASDTIKGAFLTCRSVAGTAPSATVGNTTGALYSAGLFTGGDQAVSNGGTLNVTYTASV